MSLILGGKDWEDEYHRIKVKNEELKSVVHEKDDQIRKCVTS